jgi:pimeloyl-ACP methyl ester carboxylesterase
VVDLFTADLRPQLSKLTAPILVVASVPSAVDRRGLSVEALKKQWLDVMKNAPHAKVVFFEETRHFIQDDRPKELDAAIEDFLAGREVNGVTAPPSASTPPATVPAASQPNG